MTEAKKHIYNEAMKGFTKMIEKIYTFINEIYKIQISIGAAYKIKRHRFIKRSFSRYKKRKIC